MALPIGDLHGLHLSVEHIADAEWQRTCEMEVEELAVIGDLVLATCWTCLAAEENEVHVFDLLTNLWRDDITLDRGVRDFGPSLFSLRRHRFHVLTPSLLGFVLNSEEISIQQLSPDRRFTLLYVIDFGMIWMRFDDCINVDGLFFSPDTPNTFFLYGENFGRECILEATVGDFDPNDPQLRVLRSIQRIHIWDPPDTVSHICAVFRYENNVFIVRIGEGKQRLAVFDCSSRQLNGVLGHGAQLEVAGDANWENVSPRMMRYELSTVWLDKGTILIPSASIQHDIEEAIEWWTIEMEKDKNGAVQPRWRFCVSPFARNPLAFSDQGISLPSDDVLFVKNSSKSIYRIPARCFGKVKKLTELAKDALLAAIPVAEREIIKGSAENIESLITLVCTKIYP